MGSRGRDVAEPRLTCESCKVRWTHKQAAHRSIRIYPNPLLGFASAVRPGGSASLRHHPRCTVPRTLRDRPAKARGCLLYRVYFGVARIYLDQGLLTTYA